VSGFTASHVAHPIATRDEQSHSDDKEQAARVHDEFSPVHGPLENNALSAGRGSSVSELDDTSN
jgi:hypothetical protein